MSQITISDGAELVNRQILLNNISFEMLTTQTKLLEVDKQLIDINVDIATKKKAILVLLNSVLGQQINEFTEDRQTQCANYIAEMNKLDELTEDAQQLINSRKQSMGRMDELIFQFNKIKETIPDMKKITNTKISQKSKGSACTIEARDTVDDF